MGLDRVEIIFHLEETFDIKIPTLEIETLVKVSDFHALIIKYAKEETWPKETLIQKVNELIAEQADYPLEKLHPDLLLRADLGMD